MRDGRSHAKQAKKAYAKRKDAEGYGRPYRALDVAEPSNATQVEAEEAAVPLGALLSTKDRKRLAHAGVSLSDPA